MIKSVIQSPFDLNLRHLAIIIAANEAGNISAAAAVINLSQPAVTQALAKIEAQLGHRLFDRQPNGIASTNAGQLLIPRIERALAYISRGGQAVRRNARLPPLPHIERRLTMNQLRALMAVDEAGSFALAATCTGFSQPALHRPVRNLEQMLGIDLITRQGRTVKSTPAAVHLLRFIRLAHAELRAGFEELAGLLLKGAGRVTVGAMPLSRALLLPQALAQFARANPHATVNVVEGPYIEMLANLRQGDLDLLIGALREPLPLKDVVQEGLFDDDPVIVGRKDHPLRHAGQFDFRRLLDFPWAIAGTGTPVRTRWEQMFRDQALEPPNLRIECGSIMVLRGLMLEDDWLTLMSRDQFHFEERAGLLSVIPGAGTTLRRRIGLTVREDWRPTKLQAEFVATFRSVCDNWASGQGLDRALFRYA